MAREVVYIPIILKEMGHKQPPTPLQPDNTIADTVINGKVQPKQTKAMNVYFHNAKNNSEYIGDQKN